MGGNRVCVSHNHADDLLESYALNGAELEPTSYQPHDFCASSDAARSALDLLGGASGEWLNVIVGSRQDERGGDLVACRLFSGKLSSGSILHLDDNVYVASANLNLLLQASELHFVQLCQMLGRYWGTFSFLKDEKGDLCERAPLTTEEGLSNYLSGISKVPGLKALRDAMRYTCANAASPQEVNLQLALCLPPVCSGFALKKPAMNYVVELGPEERVLYDANEIRIDLYWPDAQFGLEYLGEKEHQEKVCSDISRWYAARKKGIELWFVTKAQLGEARAMDLIARELARRTRKKINESTWPAAEEVQVLLDALRGVKAIDPKERIRARRLRA